MNKYWVFASRNKENIKVAAKNLLWGFWKKPCRSNKEESVLAKNWRQFLHLYNQVAAGDVVFFQLTKSGDIHAIGVVKDRFYDDQTPVWDEEDNKGMVLFPWRISFYVIIYSEESLGRYFTNLENYVDGYGIGEVPHKMARDVLDKLRERLSAVGVYVSVV